MIGETAFKKGIQSYYKNYMNGSATTNNFKQEMEKAANQDLTTFFNQWLHRGGLIKIKSDWKYDSIKKQLTLTVNQIQNKNEFYSFPLDITITIPGNNQAIIKKVVVNKATEIFVFPLAKIPVTIELDPRKVLLSKIELVKTGEQ